MTRIRRYPPRGITIDQEYRKKGILRPFNISLPEKALIPLLQHGTKAARPVVKAGTAVDEGMVIGEAIGDSVMVHSSIPGTVTGFRTVRFADGRQSEAVEVELSGVFSSFSASSRRRDDTASLSPDAMIDAIDQAGLIHDEQGNGALGSAFRAALGKSCTTIVLNLMETLPCHRVGTSLLCWKGESVARGLLHAIRILGATRVFVVLPPGVEKQCPDFFAAIGKQVSGLHIVTMTPRYPAHRPEVLLPSLLRLPPADCVRPLEVGTMLLAARTCLAMHEAIDLGQPLLETYLHLSGASMARESVVKARIGTPLWAVVEDAGGLVSMPSTIVVNDPMDAWTTRNIDLPVTKEMSAVMFLTEEETRQAPASECIHCSQCIQGCPVGLEPETLYKLLRMDQKDKSLAMGLDTCTGCGFCSYACPSHIPLVQTFRVEQTRPQGDKA